LSNYITKEELIIIKNIIGFIVALLLCFSLTVPAMASSEIVMINSSGTERVIGINDYNQNINTQINDTVVESVYEPIEPIYSPCDVNQDNEIDVLDLLFVVQYFVDCVPTDQISQYLTADVNDDLIVDVLDLLEIVSHME
jgi:hypothetical protein